MTETELQAAIDAMPGGGTVELPAGEITLTRPIRLRHHNTGLRGKGRHITKLRMWRKGPAVVICGEYPPFPTTPPLCGGAMASLDLKPGVDVKLNLRESGLCELDGLSQFCVEFWWKPRAETSQPSSIVASSGRMHRGDSAFFVRQISGSVATMLNIGGVDRLLNVGGLLSGHTYHIALTYDGAMVRLFRNGILVTQTPATGKLVQASHEDVMIGEQTGHWPEVTTEIGVANGELCGLTLWKQARYMFAFTPPTAATLPSSQTLLQMTGETLGVCHVGRIDATAQFPIGEPAYLPTRRTMNDASVVGIHLESLGIQGSLRAFHTISSRFTDLAGTFAHQGFLFARDCFSNTFSGLLFLGAVGCQYCLQNSGGGNNHFTGVNDITGGDYPVGISAGSGLASFIITPTWRTVFSLSLRGFSGGASVHTMLSLLTDDESPTPAGQTRRMRAQIFLDDVTAIFVGAGIENIVGGTTFPAPCVLVRDCNGVAFDGSVFSNNSGKPVFEFLGRPSRVSVRDSHRRGAAPAWVDAAHAGYVSVTNSGTA